MSRQMIASKSRHAAVRRYVCAAAGLAVAVPLYAADAVDAAPAQGAESIKVTGNATLASQYISRGARASWGHPVLQGGFDLTHKNGLFAGVWASPISSNILAGGGSEFDIYGGYNGSYQDLGYSLAYYYYDFPGAKSSEATGRQRSNYAEIVPGLSYGWVSVKYWLTVSRDFFGVNNMSINGAPGAHSRGSGYLDVNVAVPLPQQMTATLHYGRLSVRNFPQVGYQDVKVQLSKEFAPTWSAALAYSRGWEKSHFYRGYSNGDGGPAKNILGSTLTASVTKTF